AMRGLDAILLPSTACVAPLIAAEVDTSPLVRFTRPFNLTGQPVFSLPAPVDGLPVRIQVIGNVGRDVELAAVAAGLERAGAASCPHRPFASELATASIRSMPSVSVPT